MVAFAGTTSRTPRGVSLAVLILLACSSSKSSGPRTGGATGSGGPAGVSGGSGPPVGAGGGATSTSGAAGRSDLGGAGSGGSTSAATADASAGLSDASLSSSSWSSACAAYGKAACDVNNRCNPITVRVYFGTTATCEARYGGKDCEAQGSAPGSKLAPSDLLACANARASETCLEVQSRVLAECFPHGDMADDSPCTYAHQCRSGFCNLVSNSWCGQCKPRGKLGDSCAAWLHSCEDGLVCASPNSGPAVWTCVRPLSAGDTCDSDLACPPSFLCINNLCAPAKQLGEACKARDCDSYNSLTCWGDGAARVCQPIPFGAAGDSCIRSGELQCTSSGFCRENDAGTDGICVAASADGAPCDSSTACLYPAVCLNGKCTRASDVAGSCK